MRYRLTNVWDEWARDARLATAPEDGHYVTHEMVTIHWMKETNENGDIIYRRMSDDEVEVMKANDKEGNK
jgi:hypothetical protein